MKKFSYLLLGAACLVLASCSNEDVVKPGVSGDTANITINLSTPQLQTRTYSKGENATLLQYAIYEIDEEGNYKKVSDDDKCKVENFVNSTTLTIKLINDHTYSLVFWAASDFKDSENESPYTLTFGESDAFLSVNYKNASTNDENLDAFYSILTIDQVNGDAQLSTQLKRPFAQINVGTDDFEDVNERKGNLPTKSSITVKKVFDKLDLFTGNVSSENNGDAEFKEASIPQNEVFPKTTEEKKYDYLAMAYILVSDDSQVYEVSFTYDDGELTKSRPVSSVPLQRNYRTNIYGSILTSSNNITVDKDPEWGGEDNDREIITVPDNKVKYDDEVYDDIESAIAKAVSESDYTPSIYVGEGEFSAEQIYFNNITDLTLKGVGDKSKTIIEFDGAVYSNKSKAASDGKNVTMEDLTIRMKPYTGSQMTESSNAAFVHLAKENYKNCIIEGCVRLVVDGEANFEGCVFNNTEASGYNGYAIWHSGVSGTTVNVKDCEFNMVSKGILLYYTGETLELNLNIENSKFVASAKGDKAAIMINTQDVSKAMYGTVKIKDTSATNFDDSRNNGLWREEKNGSDEQTNGFDIYVNDELVQASKYFKVDDVWYQDAKTAFNAIENNSTIELGTTVVDAKAVTWPSNKNVTFIGKDATSGINNMEWHAMNGCNITVKNIVLDVVNATGRSIAFQGLSKAYYENVTFNGEWHTYDGEQTYKDCTFNYTARSDNGNGRYNCFWYGRAYTEFIGCNFNAKDTKAILGYDNTYDSTKTKGAMSDLKVEDCSFDSSNNPTAATTAHACVEIHTECFNSYGTVTIDHANVAEGKFTYRKVWFEGSNDSPFNKLFGPTETKNCTWIIDGETVQTGK